MTPLQLTIQGLYSYQDKPQTIDFRHLTAAQVFGIFGATGSGKSSILEAISFALYGKTERLTQQDRRNYNMMNLKSGKMLIDFEFSGGEKEEKQYKFIVRGRRNKKNFQDVPTLDREAFIQDGDEWTPIEVDSAEEVLGLSYENFKRTIIIPQGKFQEFLSIGPTERTRMLREIFHLEKYELAFKVGALDKKNQLAMAEKETLLVTLEGATPESEKGLVDQLSLLEKEVATHQQKLKSEEAQIKKMEAVQELTKKLKDKKKDLEELESQSESILKREKQLQQYETCLSTFQPIRIRKQEYSTSLDSLHKDLIFKKEVADGIQKKLHLSEETFKSIREQYYNRESLAQKAREIELVSDLKALAETEADKNERLKKGNGLIETSRKKIEGLKERSVQLGSEIQQEKENLPGLKVLMEIRSWLATSEQLSTTSTQLEAQLSNLEERETSIQSQKTEALKQTSIGQSQFGLSFQKLGEILSGELAELTEKRKKLEAEKATLAAQAQLHLLAETLTEGAPCPLCGATHHPNALTPESIGPKRNALEGKLASINEAFTAGSRAQIELVALQKEAQRFQLETQAAKANLQAHRKEVDLHDTSFSWQGYSKDNPEAIRKEIAKAGEMEALIQTLESQKKVVDSALEKETETLALYKSRIDELRTELATVSASLSTQVKGLKTIRFDDYRYQENLKLEQQAAQLRADYESIEDLYQETEKHIRQLRTNLDTQKGEIDAQEAQQHDLTIKLAQQVKVFNQALSQSEFSTEREVEGILDLALNTQAERNSLTQYRQAVQSAKEAIEELSDQLSGNTLDLSQYDALIEQSNETREVLAGLNRKSGGLNQELSRIREQLTQKKKLQKELNKLKFRAENLSTLKKMFARSGFVNYVSTIYLQNLCVAANHRFRKLTRGSLRLEATPANQFEVRDFLNDGQVRSVKTLSGGQTFQAALSLALALAEQVQQQLRSKQNFFFIDEGFGSQDKQSLQAIFEALKGLRKENRVVGVISHVEELQQEIDTYLSVENDPEKGSVVTSSWR